MLTLTMHSFNDKHLKFMAVTSCKNLMLQKVIPIFKILLKWSLDFAITAVGSESFVTVSANFLK